MNRPGIRQAVGSDFEALACASRSRVTAFEIPWNVTQLVKTVCARKPCLGIGAVRQALGMSAAHAKAKASEVLELIGPADRVGADQSGRMRS